MPKPASSTVMSLRSRSGPITKLTSSLSQRRAALAIRTRGLAGSAASPGLLADRISKPPAARRRVSVSPSGPVASAKASPPRAGSDGTACPCPFPDPDCEFIDSSPVIFCTGLDARYTRRAGCVMYGRSMEKQTSMVSQDSRQAVAWTLVPARVLYMASGKGCGDV